jgi:tetratricopeptide (TPR) repeat protein
MPQTFLWWANPAVHVNDDYQSIFPPDVYAVMDHGKRAVSSFPIATGVYYKVDYAPGTDISRYKTIPVPTSYMAYHSDFDFLGCYDHGKQAGMLHVANHHLVPGKKQWTWGNGDFGRAWDRQLTDEDGPYIELMCGAFTDNQPDFAWLQPGEEKRFTQVFMPFKQIGGVKNASKEVAVNLEFEGGAAQFGVYCSSPRTLRVMLEVAGRMVYEQEAMLSPEQVLQDMVALPAGLRPQLVTLRVLAGEQELIAYTPLAAEHPAPPPPATAARPPAEIASNEELFLNGLHLEQYRHATYEPEPYYLEALRRDRLDSRCNNALGRLLLRRGRFAEAESYFRKAVESITRRNPNPYDGEPYYNLGLALRWQGHEAEAFDAFYKAVWNAAWQDAAYFELARLATRRGEYTAALDLADACLQRNGRHHGARHLQVALLRRTGNPDEAQAASAGGLALDAMNYGLYYERLLLAGDPTFWSLLRTNVHTCMEIALDYARAGLWSEADRLLGETPATDPMVLYYQGWVRLQAGDISGADQAFARAETLSPDYCFPNALECVPALETAMQCNPAGARAPYYLGCFWYAHRRYEEAIGCWERACERDPDFATVHRNLGLAYMNKRHDPARALASYARAFALDPTSARVFFELDQLYKKLGTPPAERLGWLLAQPALVEQRDDLTLEVVGLLNLLGRHAEALDRLLARTFHPWEGGEGKVTGQYVTALVELARARLDAGDAAGAISYLGRARSYPHNLGEGKLAGAQENHIFYYLGCAYAAFGDDAQAHACFERAAEGSAELAAALYYNDQPPDMVFYQALAHARLGRVEQAAELYRQLVAYGRRHRDDDVQLDYFAVSLPDFLVFDDDLSLRNRIHCHYMAGLGYLGLSHLGLGDLDEALAEFEAVLAWEPAHLGATLHRRLALSVTPYPNARGVQK